MEFASSEEAEIFRLKNLIHYMIDVFAARDATQRGLIEQYKAVIGQQSAQIAWFEGAHAPNQPMGEKQ